MHLPLLVAALALLIATSAGASRQATEEIIVTTESTWEVPGPAPSDAALPQTSQYESGYAIPFLTETLGLLWTPAPNRPDAERFQHCRNVSVVHGAACY